MGTGESFPRVDSSDPLLYRDPSVLRSRITDPDHLKRNAPLNYCEISCTIKISNVARHSATVLKIRKYDWISHCSLSADTT